MTDLPPACPTCDNQGAVTGTLTAAALDLHRALHGLHRTLSRLLVATLTPVVTLIARPFTR